MSLIDLIQEKLKNIPIELDSLKDKNIIFERRYKSLIFVDKHNNYALIKFEKHTSLSVFPRNFIKIYRRSKIANNMIGACFVQNENSSNVFEYYYEPFTSSVLFKNEIRCEILEILLMLNINLTVQTSNNGIYNGMHKVIKLTLE